MCSFDTSPLEGHYRRALHALRYLSSTVGIGSVFCSTSVQLIVFTDAAFAVFRSGFSSSGIIFCIRQFNAPFQVIAQSQHDMATCSMTAEYYAANQACKNIQYLSQILHQLGWPSSSPVPLYMDSHTAINLVRAPPVSVSVGILSENII